MNMIFSIRSLHVRSVFVSLALVVVVPTAFGQGTQTQSVIGNTVTPSAMIGLGNIAGVASNAASGGGQFFSGSTVRFGLPGQGDTGAAAAVGRNAWNGWVAYSQNRVGYSFEPLQSSGTVNLGMVGVDYTLANNMVVGVALAGDRTDITMNGSALTGSLKGSGYTISPYLGMPLGKAWVFDATVGFGRTKIDTVQFGNTGSFRTDRTMGSVGLSYRQAIGKWQLTGRGAVLAVEDRLGSFTMSNGTFNPDGRVNLSQLRISGQAGYNLGQVVPYVGLSYIYDIRRPDQAPVAGQSAANDRDAWAPSIGVRFSSGGALYGGLQYTTEKSRSQVKNNQILFNLGLRF
jgi:hypothetical protein